jgi:hypothetical protein
MSSRLLHDEILSLLPQDPIAAADVLAQMSNHADESALNALYQLLPLANADRYLRWGILTAASGKLSDEHPHQIFRLVLPLIMLMSLETHRDQQGSLLCDRLLTKLALRLLPPDNLALPLLNADQAGQGVTRNGDPKEMTFGELGVRLRDIRVWPLAVALGASLTAAFSLGRLIP